MKKLQSLESFKASGLDQKSMSKLLGGTPVKTEGGEVCSAATSSGCLGYKSDTIDGAETTYHDYYEIDKPCED